MIHVEKLCKRYGPVEAIKDVSFEVRPGEILGFLGPNGAGKSTTMKIITGFFPQTSGTVTVNGMPFDKHETDIKRIIGYLPENVPLYYDMRVKDFLEFSVQAKKVDRKKRSLFINRTLDQCSLGAVQNRIIGTLSKGYKQRVGLAQALVGDPKILILDEPTIGLDPKQIIEIRQLIKQMAGEKTVILSTHILPEVSMISQRVIIINQGTIVAMDTPDNLRSRLQSSHDILLKVLGDSETVSKTIMSVPHVQHVSLQAILSDGNEYLVNAEKGHDVRPHLAKALATHPAGLQLLEMKMRPVSLEDIFLKIVTKEEETV